MIDRPLLLRCGLTLKNRIVKAAMTEGLSPGGHPSRALERLYARWAKGGAGLQLTGAVYADALHTVRPGDVVARADAPLDAWRSWAKAATADGAAAFVQINHAGRQTLRVINASPLAPSAVPAVGNLRVFGTPRAATEVEIAGIIAGFVRAARVAEASGFHGVQVHAAHGYLLSQFLSGHINQRADEWGGSPRNRARLLLRIVREIAAAVSPRFALAVKLNASDFQRGGFSEDEAVDVVRMLSEERVDLIEVSGGTYEQPASFGVGIDPREAYFLGFARRARGATAVPLLLTGGMRRRATMETALSEGASLVGMGRALVMEPELPRRMLEGQVDAARPLRARFVRGRYAAASELAWYSDKLRRVAAGEDVTTGGWSWLALVRQSLADMRLARRQRVRLLAPPPPLLSREGRV
jgi:2,4-dienoyl-CoA reductase-like NADH-dependent reductase (Old Yellow Enzyme family)